jgi:outer membrane biosynthesis protein TonB
MKTALAVSAGLHVTALLCALVWFPGKAFDVTPTEPLDVSIISDKDFSKMTNGAKDAPKLEVPKPLVEKKDDPKPADDPAPKLTEKKEIKSTAEKTPEPQPQTKPDPIAEELKKHDDKPQKETKSDPPPPKKSSREQAKFDAEKIAALLDKRDPQLQCRDRRGAQFGAFARRRFRHRRPTVAIRDRRAARTADGAMESTGRRAGRG